MGMNTYCQNTFQNTCLEPLIEAEVVPTLHVPWRMRRFFCGVTRDRAACLVSASVPVLVLLPFFRQHCDSISVNHRQLISKVQRIYSQSHSVINMLTPFLTCVHSPPLGLCPFPADFATHALRCRDGDTPLQWAINNNASDVAAYLRSVGAPQ